MNKKHFLSLCLILIIVMLFSALGPTTVYADDGAPTDTTSSDASAQNDASVDEGDTGGVSGESGSDEAEQAVTEDEATDTSVGDETDPVSTEEAAAEEEVDAAATEQVVTEDAGGVSDEGVAEEPSLMEQVPDNTEVVVINAEGKVEPLATQEAADAVVAIDPVWCPAGASPGDTGCTSSYSSFDDLLTFIKTNEQDPTYQQAGTIFIEMGNYGGGETSIDFNAYGFTAFNNNDLTLQGGWNTSDNSTSSTTTFDIPIIIGSDVNPWGGSLTLRNIIVSGVVADTGLTVYSSGDVTVEDSEFNNNDTAGALIDAGGDVTVRRSKINNNGSNAGEIVDGKGLEIKSGGFVTLSDVEANDNQIFGADIESLAGVAIADSMFNGNLLVTLPPEIAFYGYGLAVVSQGDITLGGGVIDPDTNTVVKVGVEANGNFLWGAWLDGANVFIENSTFNRNITDSDMFLDDTGLVIITPGDAFLDYVQANENRLIGADIRADGQVSIQNSSFDNNSGTIQDASGVDTYWGCGLKVAGAPVVDEPASYHCDPSSSSASSINLSKITAIGNYLYGANLFSSGDVNISDSSFSNNDASPSDQGYGLMVDGGSSVALRDVTANANNLFGIDINADGLIDLTDVTVGNNGLYGVKVVSPTGINLVRVNALGNGLPNGDDGTYAESVCVYLDGGAYTGNGGYGLNVPNGVVDVNSVPTFSGNGLGDTNPDINLFTDCPTNGNGGGGGVIVTSPTPYTVTPQTLGQLPAALGQGYTFVSALQVSGTAASFELSFPIPAGMENADLVVMFWDGSQWVEIPGGSVVNSEFVITVTQPGIYVLVSQST